MIVQSANVNWNDINKYSKLNTGGINWNDLNKTAQANAGLLNWTNFPATGIATWNGSSTPTATATTGTGNVVLATSPTLITPTLGTASATGLTVTSLSTSSPVFTNGSSSLVSGSVTGSTTKLVSSTGALTPGDILKVDAFGNAIDGGTPSGTGTVTSVGLSSSASTLTVTNSPVTTYGTINADFNWTTINGLSAINNGGINWSSINQVAKINMGGINWNDAYNLNYGVNWTRVNLITNSYSSVGTGVGAIKLYDLNGINWTGFQGGTTALNNYFTMPLADGSSGQYVQTNGSRALSFGTPVSSGSQYQIPYYATAGATVSGNAGLVWNQLNLELNSPDSSYNTVTSGDQQILIKGNNNNEITAYDTDGGPGVMILGTDSGSATTNNTILGALLFQAAPDANHNLHIATSAAVEAQATQAFTTSNMGTQLIFKTTPNNSTTKATVLTLGQSGSVTIANATGASAATLCVSTTGQLGKVTGGTVTSPTCTTF